MRRELGRREGLATLKVPVGPFRVLQRDRPTAVHRRVEVALRLCAEARP